MDKEKYYTQHNQPICEVIDYVQEKLINEPFPSSEVWDSFRLSVKCGAQDTVLESLCGNIDDFELLLPNEIYKKLLNACQFYSIDKKYWKNIKHE